jgi:hypothetical protein
VTILNSVIASNSLTADPAVPASSFRFMNAVTFCDLSSIRLQSRLTPRICNEQAEANRRYVKSAKRWKWKHSQVDVFMKALHSYDESIELVDPPRQNTNC